MAEEEYEFEQYHYPPYVPSHGHTEHFDERSWMSPDWIPVEHQASLPGLSVMGRGPRGEGITVETDETEDGFSFVIKSDVTGEVIFESGNLFGGAISIRQSDYEVAPGQSTTFYIDITRGGTTTSYPVKVNPGSAGSRIYTYHKGIKERKRAKPSDIYTCPMKDLDFYSTQEWLHLPLPRINDTIITSVKCKNSYWTIGVGTIVAIENGIVTFLLRTIRPAATPHIVDGNWWIGDTDTGVCAQGMSSEEIKKEIETDVSSVLEEKNLLTKEEISNLIDDKISKISYYIDDDGVLVREIAD